MTRRPRPLVVRRRDISARPLPPGGDFQSKSLTRFTMPRMLTAHLGVFCVDASDRVVGLTYDDGPHPEHTPRILDVLAARSTSATFFVLSRQAEKHPDVIRRIVDEGHELALHGRDHQSLLTLSASAAVSRIREARAIVEGIAGAPVRLYRPPYGRCTWSQLLGIRLLGLEAVMWSSDATDWVHDSEEAIAERSLSGVFPGGILLLHDDRGDPETLGIDELLPAFDRARVTELILATLTERGYRGTTVGELFERYRQVRSASRAEMVRG